MEPNTLDPKELFIALEGGKGSTIYPDIPKDDKSYKFDTGLGELTEYDKGLTPFINKQDNRASNQEWWQSTRNGFSQLLTGAIGEVVATPGYIMGAFEPIEEMDKGFSSLFLEAGKAISEWGQDLAPLYQSQASKDKIFAPHDSEWLSQTIADFGPTVALLASAFVTEGATTPRLLSLLRKTPGLSKYARAAQTFKGKSKIYNTLRTTNMTVLSRLAENGMEAHQTFETVYNKVKTENPEISDDEAKKLAGEAGSQVWRKNWMLAAVDFMQFGALLNGFGKFGGIAKFGGQMVSEGLEEGVQFAFQKEAEDDIDFKLGKIDEDKNTIETFIENLSNREMQKAMVQGALGGAVFAGAGSLMNKLSKKYTNNKVSSTADIIQRADDSGQLDNLSKDIDNKLNDPELKAEHKKHLEETKELINVHKQAKEANTPNSKEFTNTQVKATKLQQEENKVKESIDSKKNDTLTKNSQTVDFVTGSLGSNHIDTLRTKHKNNPTALKVLNKLEKKYNKLRDENSTPETSSEAPVLIPRVKSKINKLVETELAKEIQLEVGKDLANNKKESFDEQVKLQQLEDVKNSNDVNKLNELQNSDIEDVSKKAKNRLNSLYLKESKDYPDVEIDQDSNIQEWNEFYKNNPATFLADKKRLFKEPELTIEEFNNRFEEFKPLLEERNNNRVLNEAVKKQEPIANTKEVVEDKIITGEADKIDPDTISDSETKEVVEAITEPPIVPHTKNEVVIEEIPKDPQWASSNDMLFYRADQNKDTKEWTLSIGRKTYSLDKWPYDKPNLVNGYHVVEQDGSPVSWSNTDIDVGFLRRVYEITEKPLDQHKIYIQVDMDYSDGNWSNANANKDNLKIFYVIKHNGKEHIIGQVPAINGSIKNKEHLQQLKEFRYSIFEHSKNKQGVYEYPHTISITNTRNGRIWNTKNRNSNLKSISNEETINLGVYSGGKMWGLDQTELDRLDIGDINNYNYSEGSVYWFVTNPVTGKIFPIRLFTKTVEKVPNAEIEIKKILAKLTPDNALQVRKEVSEYVRWKDKDTDAIQPDFGFTKDGVLVINGEYITVPDDSTIQDVIYNTLEIGKRTLQVSTKRINETGYNETLMRDGYIETDINPFIHFHSPKFKVDYTNLKPVAIETGQNITNNDNIFNDLFSKKDFKYQDGVKAVSWLWENAEIGDRIVFPDKSEYRVSNVRIDINGQREVTLMAFEEDGTFSKKVYILSAKKGESVLSNTSIKKILGNIRYKVTPLDGSSSFIEFGKFIPIQQQNVSEQEIELTEDDLDNIEGMFKLETEGYVGESWDIKAGQEWLAKKFGKEGIVLPQQEVNDLADRLGYIAQRGGVNLWGFVHNASVYMMENAGAGTEFHEGFHIIYSYALNNRERKLLSKYGTEEQLADRFAEYVMTNKEESSVLRRIFKKLKLFIKNILTPNKITLDEFFWKYNNTTYRNIKPKKGDIFRPKKEELHPTKVKQRVRLINRLFLESLEELRTQNSNLKEEDLFKLALGKENLYQTKVVDKLSDMKISIDNNYKSGAYDELALNIGKQLGKKVTSKQVYALKLRQLKQIQDNFYKDGKPQEWYYEALNDLRRFGIFVNTIGGRDTIENTEDGLEMWMKENISAPAFDSFSFNLKKMLNSMPSVEYVTLADKGKPNVREYQITTKRGKTITKYVRTITDTFGQPIYMDGALVYNNLMQHLTGSLSQDDMLNKLDKLSFDFAWAKVLYNDLTTEDSSFLQGDIKELKANMYYRFAGWHNTQAIVVTKNNKNEFRTQFSNEKNLKSQLVKNWWNNVNSPSNPLFENTEKINKTLEVLNKVNVSVNGYKKKDRDVFVKIYKNIGVDIPIEAIDKIVAENQGQNLLLNTKAIVEGKKIGVEYLASQVKKYYPSYYQPSHIDVNGEKVQNHIRSSFMARRIERFNRSEDMEIYDGDPFYNTSYDPTKQKTNTHALWLDRFKSKKDLISFNLVDGFGGSIGKAFADMTPNEFLKYKFATYFNNGSSYVQNNRDSGKAYYSVQLFADSSSHALIGMETYTKEDALEKLVQVAYNEYNAVIDPNKLSVKNYKPEFKFFPFLAENLDVFNSRDSVKRAIKSNIEKWIKSEKQTLIDNQMMVKDEKDQYVNFDSRIDDVDTFLDNFYWNDIYAQTQIISLFYGNLSFYKNTDDFFKRAKEIWAPGDFLDDTRINKEYFTTFVEDVNVYREDIISEIEKVTSKEVADGYRNFDKNGNPRGSSETDGQGIIDIYRWAEVQVGKGASQDWVNGIVERVEDGVETSTDLEYIFNPYKPYMYDLVKVNGKVVPLQIKNSEYVLLPSMVKGNPKLKELLDKINTLREQTGLNGSMQFNSAVKVGEHKTSNEVGDITIDNTIILKNAEYRIQGEVPEHQLDTNNLLGTQLRKIVTGDLVQDGNYFIGKESLTGKEVKDEFNNILRTDVEINSKNLNDKFSDPNKFYKELQEEAIGRNYPKKIIDALEPIVTPDGSIRSKVPLYSPLIIDKAMALIASIYRNNITKIKFPGASLPNVSSYGLKRKPKVVFKNGALSHFECYMPMTNTWLRDYMDKNGFLNVAKLKELGLDFGVAYRIPTEGKYSMVPIKVIGFTNNGLILPPEITSVTGLDFDIDKMFVMLYSFDVVNGKPVKSEWKTEFDYQEYKNKVFNTKRAKELLVEYDTVEGVIENAEGLSDILKNLFQSSTKNEILQEEGILLSELEWNKLSIYEKNSKKARDNRKLDLVRAVLNSPHTVKSQFDGGNFDRLEALAKKLDPTKKNINPLLATHRSSVFENMMAGKALIGIGANYVATHQLMQDQGLELTDPVRFNGLEGTDLGGVFVQEYVVEEKYKKEDIKLGETFDVLGNQREIFQIKDNRVWHRNPNIPVEDAAVSVEPIKDLLDKLNLKKLTNKLVTSELAQFNASFVDNGKNPLAAKYNMNTYTADVGMLVAKFYGMETAMRFISHPMVKEFYNKYIQYGGDYKAEQAVIKEYFPNMKFTGKKRTVPVNINSSDLVNPNAKDINVLQAFVYFKKNQAKDLGELVNAMKVADNGMQATIEKTLVSLDSIDKVTTNLSDDSDIIGDKIKDDTISGTTKYFNNKELHTTIMVDEGIHKPIDRLVNEFMFPEYRGGAYKSLREYFASQKSNGKLNEKEMKLIHQTLMNYMVSDFELFNVISRNDLIKNFPDVFLTAKQSNENVKSKYRVLFGNIKIDTSRVNEKYRILKVEGGLNEDTENEIITQWEMMLSDSTTIPKTNMTYADFATTLVQYAFITKGFRFGVGSFSSILPVNFYADLKNSTGKSFDKHIQDNIQMANNDSNSMDNFRDQFVRNYFPRLSFVRTVDPETDVVKYNDNKEMIGVLVAEQNQLGGGEFHDYVKIKDDNNKWHLFRNTIDNTYVPVSALGLYNEVESWSKGSSYPKSDTPIPKQVQKDSVKVESQPKYTKDQIDAMEYEELKKQLPNCKNQ